MFKTYIGISRDHSGSMSSIAGAAARDYNSKIKTITSASTANNQETFVSIVECGYGNTDAVRRVQQNVPLSQAQYIPENRYEARGRGTPLWDSVGELIEMFEASPDINNIDASFLVMVITDGAENASRKYNPKKLAEKIRELELTDRWTFVFRVPRNAGRSIVKALGISEGNIQEWDQTDRGVQIASTIDSESFTQYFSDRSQGIRSTKKFYTNLTEVTSKEVAAVLTDVSSEVSLFPVTANDDQVDIRTFIEKRINGKMLKGAGFYQLVKTEPTVQDNKKILIRDKTTQSIYFGAAARQMLGLPSYGNVRLAPGEHGNFDIFIQSTSVNRKMNKGTTLVYWPNVGTRYKEGPSA